MIKYNLNMTAIRNLIFFFTLINIAVLSIFIYIGVFYEKPKIDTDAAKEKMFLEARAKNYGQNYKFDPLLINIDSNRNKLGFLSLEMTLILFENKYVGIVDNFKPYISDLIIYTVSQMKVDLLNTVYGKILLEERIKKRINKLLKKKLVKDILFTKFIIQ